MSGEDDEIIQEFLVESYENLDQLDRDFVELEQHPGSRELLSSIFRTIHTIKGTSGFLALSRLERVTHIGENLLSKLRDGEMSMTPRTADALLHMVDCVRSLLTVIENTGSDADPSVDIDVVVDELAACLDPAAPAVEAPAPVTVADSTPVEAVATPEPSVAAAE
ncbi:MAG: Hpt domain-containing protein, partial [Jatrophihabitans sp.]|uniref:Hpt domain-containing protein n=1 Tax=Jatrophihabitans sp. TaxID=1932789 RepID=UPI003F7E8090